MRRWWRTMRLSIKSLLLHPLRSGLTILGIFIGIAGVIWLLAIGDGIGRKAEEQIAELGARNIIVSTVKPSSDEVQDSGYGLTRADFERVRDTISTLKRALPIRILSKEFRYLTRKFEGRLVGCTPDYAEVSRLEVDQGRFLTDSDGRSERNYCVLAEASAKKLFPFGDPLGKRIMADDEFYIVVGTMKKRHSSSAVGGSTAVEDFSSDVYIPIESLWRRLGDMIIVTKPGQFQSDLVEVSRFNLEVHHRDQVLNTAEVVKNTIEADHTLPDYSVTVPLELLQQAETTRLMFVIFLGMIAAVSLVVGGIGIMNIMLATVTERTREIGIRRALGAKRRDITRQFLAESVVLSVVGGLLGIGGGLLCTLMTVEFRTLLEYKFPEQMLALPEIIREVEPTVVPWSIPVAFSISVIVGVVFGVYPAIRAAKLDPIEALRHE
ncbi:ABC transporter permease [Adhaeretor mobilis]|uniref:Macrolide export ATP-binding/permease protein MacB n=1 Tax=Adhaeretor mobilis TaxID=1930276 RepID=A0A517MZN5_9BACT|nr:ABC transporter permease [Adhaeretor mobilis]QDT00347.1 Macrolide export ATP-binding/permease protein MacB [Adhaeretor mobilis]